MHIYIHTYHNEFLEDINVNYNDIHVKLLIFEGIYIYIYINHLNNFINHFNKYVKLKKKQISQIVGAYNNINQQL